MNEEKLQSLIHMSKRYLNNTLSNHEKKQAEEISRSLFYETLYDEPPDSELNKKIRLFAVMAHHFSNNKPMCNQKVSNLKVMVETMQHSVQ